MKLALPLTIPTCVLLTRRFGLHDAEVGQLHLAQQRDHDVAGRDVAVDDPHRRAHLVALLVRVGQRLQRLVRDVVGERRGEAGAVLLDVAAS